MGRELEHYGLIRRAEALETHDSLASEACQQIRKQQSQAITVSHLVASMEPPWRRMPLAGWH
jgi:hypothetical protein